MERSRAGSERAERGAGGPASAPKTRTGAVRRPGARLPAPLRLGLIAVAMTCACGRGPDGGIAPLLLVSIDTLPADRVGAWGHPAARTPVIDRLARTGLQVRDAISPAPLTLPSHATMLTGLDPPAHGLRDNGLYRLGDTTPTLAELLPDGVPTAGFIGGFPLVRTFGLGRGFDVWDDTGLSDASVARHPQRRADEVLESARSWLGHRVGEPRPFAFLHLYDPHHPYEAPAPWPRAVAASGGDGFDAEVAWTDRALGRFLAGVQDVFAVTPRVIVTADHGESLGAHGEPTHANFIYDATQRVPLALAGPGAPHRLETRPRRLADVAATVLDLYDVNAEGRGESLLAGSAGAPAYVETMHTKLFKGWSPLFGARTDRWKYVRAPRPELYDIVADPAERDDLFAERPDVVRVLSGFVDSVLATEKDGPAPGLTDDVRERLAALGYVAGGASGDTAGSPGPVAKDPKDGIVATAALFRGQQAFLRGDLAEAERQLREAVTADPALKDAHAYLSGVYLRTDRPEAAVRHAERALELEPHVNEQPIRETLARAREATRRTGAAP